MKTWATEKIAECVSILRSKLRKGTERDAIDLAEDALWSKNPDVRDARGYLEAWADVADITVSELIDLSERGEQPRRLAQ